MSIKGIAIYITTSVKNEPGYALRRGSPSIATHHTGAIEQPELWFSFMSVAPLARSHQPQTCDQHAATFVTTATVQRKGLNCVITFLTQQKISGCHSFTYFRFRFVWYGHPTGYSLRRETTRQTEEAMGRQHQRVDWP